MKLKVDETVEENDDILKYLNVKESKNSSNITCKIFAV